MGKGKNDQSSPYPLVPVMCQATDCIRNDQDLNFPACSAKAVMMIPQRLSPDVPVSVVCAGFQPRGGRSTSTRRERHATLQANGNVIQFPGSIPEKDGGAE